MMGRTQICSCEGIIRDLAIRPNGPGRLTRMAGICHLPRKRPMRLILTTPGSVSGNPSSCVATRASGSLSKCRRLLAESADVVAERVTPCPVCNVTLPLSVAISFIGMSFAMKSGNQMQLMAVASIQVWISKDQNIVNDRFAIAVPARNQRPFLVKLWW